MYELADELTEADDPNPPPDPLRLQERIAVALERGVAELANLGDVIERIAVALENANPPCEHNWSERHGKIVCSECGTPQQ